MRTAKEDEFGLGHAKAIATSKPSVALRDCRLELASMVRDAWDQYILGSGSSRAEEQKKSLRRTSPNEGCAEAAGAWLPCMLGHTLVPTTQGAKLFHSFIVEAL